MVLKNHDTVLMSKFFLPTVESRKTRLQVLSELGCDTDHFDKSLRAWDNYLKFLLLDKPAALYIDGMLTKITCPEIMGIFTTWWEASREDAEKASKDILYHDQSHWILNQQTQRLDEILKKVRKALPDTEIVINFFTDDTHFTSTEVINEMLLSARKNLGIGIKDLRAAKKEAKVRATEGKAEIAALERERKELENAAKDRTEEAEKSSESKTEGYKQELAKLTEVDKKTRLLIRRKKENAQKRINRAEAEIGNLNIQIGGSLEEKALFRPKKTRPVHQTITRAFVKEFRGRYKKVCDKYNIRVLHEDVVFQVGTGENAMVVEAAHSRHRTWAVVKGREKKLVVSTHGKWTGERKRRFVEFVLDAGNSTFVVEEINLENAREHPDMMDQILEDARLRGVDVILETGHNGIGYKRLQKMEYDPDAANMRNNASYSPTLSSNHVTIVMARPFENQKLIGQYSKGKRPIRMAGGIPLNTRSHEVFKRYSNDCVSGLTIIEKLGEGMIYHRGIDFDNFDTGAVLKKANQIMGFSASSDEHIGAKQANLMAVHTFQKLVKYLRENPLEIDGKIVDLTTHVNAGDTGEADEISWPYRDSYTPNPKDMKDLIRQEIHEIVRSSDPGKITRYVDQMLSLTMAGSTACMDTLLDWFTDYLLGYVQIMLKDNKMRWVSLIVPGNHVKDVLKKLGMEDHSRLRYALKTLNIGYRRVGVDKHFDRFPEHQNPRVYLGGHQNARHLVVTDFGVDTEGNVIYGPFKLGVFHDPKGSGLLGLIGFLKSHDLHVAVAGHTHENEEKAVKIADNKSGLVIRVGTLQGVTPTELVYSGIPRTHCAHLVFFHDEGDYATLAIPAYRLNRLGDSMEVETDKLLYEKS